MSWRAFAFLLIGLTLLAGCNFPAVVPPATVTLPPAAPLATGTAVPTLDLTLVAAPSRTPGPIALPETLVVPYTITPAPTRTPSPTMPPTATPTPLFDAQVAEGRGGLRLRAAPDEGSPRIANLVEFAPLRVIGRSADGRWLQVATAEGFTGWVWAAYVDQDVDWSQARPTSAAGIAAVTAAAYFQSNAAPPPVPAISGLTGHARQIYLDGQARGNRANVFSKVGDSLTVATYVLYPFGWGTYDLGEYSYLYPALAHFSAPIAREGRDSFSNVSLAADNGWTVADVLDPARADAALCRAGESPLACEYRVVRPAVALIMFGSNDVAVLSGEEFRAGLDRIVALSIERGVIPVLTTIPPRGGYEGAVDAFNALITAAARAFDVPLLDFYHTVIGLPNRGLAADGLHLSWPPGDYSAAARFTPENLSYGYAMRNLTALQVLDAVWRNALY